MSGHPYPTATARAYGHGTWRLLLRDPAGETSTEDYTGMVSVPIVKAETHAKAVAGRLGAIVRQEMEPGGRRVWWCEVKGRLDLVAAVEWAGE